VQWFSPKGSWLDLLLMAGAFGLSASIGYRGLLVLLLCGVLLLVLAGSSRASLAKALGTVCACAILSFPIYAPWLIRNIFWTNNPIYPILKRWFGAVGGLVAFSPQTLRPLPDQLIQYSGDWIDAVAIPWRMILSGRDGSLTHFDGVLSPILFLSLFPLALLRKEAWLPYFYLCLGSYFFCAACLSAPTIPLMAPIFGLVLILCACGVNLLGDLFSERHRFLLYTGIIGIQSVFGLLYGYDLAKRRDVLPYLSGQVSANEYLESRIPEYALIRTVNKDLPPTPLLYLLFIDSSFYYYNRPIISEGPNRSDFLRMLLSSSGSARLLAKELVNRNIGFIAWDQALSDEQLKHTLTPQEFTIWNRFQANHLKVVWQSERFRLAQILHRARRAKQRPENPTEAPPELKSQGNQAKFQGLVTVGK